MAVEQLFRFLASPVVLASIALISIPAICIYNRCCYGINHVPGPFLASITNWWRLFKVWGRRPELEHIALHEKYGDVVRLGPNTVSICEPQAVKAIYALNAGYVKSGFYPVQQTIARGRPLHSMFNTTDERFHAKLRRAVSNAYAMSTLVQFEPLVDSTTVAFLKQMEERYADKEGQKGVCDFGAWLQYYAFDVIGELTYSKRLGFVDRGVDVDGIIGNLEWLLDYVAVIGQMPFLDNLFLKNPIRLWFNKLGMMKNTAVVNFARERIAERHGANASENPASKSGSRDFLSRFEEAHKRDPESIPQERVLALTVANMFAGSDTTAISFRAVFYYLLRQPETMQKLMNELEDPARALFTDGLVKWNQVHDLPYLSAVIKEALRCHPAVGLTLERVVPPAGITAAGKFIPGGTIVGCNAWVLHRNEKIFGSRPLDFRPERWIEATPEARSEMNSMLFSFGAGARTCIGKNISLLELHKLVPAVLHKFELSLVDPEKGWSLHNAWFVKQNDFFVTMKTRT